MNKAEALNQIKKLYREYEAFSDEKALNVLQQHTDEVKREAIIRFAKNKEFCKHAGLLQNTTIAEMVDDWLKEKEEPRNPLAMTGDIADLPDKLKYISVLSNIKCPKCGVSGYVQLLIPDVKKCWSCNTTFEFKELEEQEEQ